MHLVRPLLKNLITLPCLDLLRISILSFSLLRRLTYLPTKFPTPLLHLVPETVFPWHPSWPRPILSARGKELTAAAGNRFSRSPLPRTVSCPRSGMPSIKLSLAKSVMDVRMRPLLQIWLVEKIPRPVRQVVRLLHLDLDALTNLASLPTLRSSLPVKVKHREILLGKSALPLSAQGIRSNE